MSEEIKNDIVEENIQDAVEGETISEEDVSNDSDTIVSDGNSVEETVLNDDVTAENVQDDSLDLVSSSDELIVEKTLTKEELEEVLVSVLTNEREAAFQELQLYEETQVSAEAPARTLFNAKLEEYTVSEGLLLCIFFLLLANFINSIFRGSHWFGKL